MSCWYSAFEPLLLGTSPSACYERVDVLSQLLQTASLRLSYCFVRGRMPPTTAWGRSLAATLDHHLLLCVLATAWYMAICLLPARGRSLAAIIRQLLACRVPELSIIRDEPGLKTKKYNHHSSEYSSPATHVRQGSWGNVCVTRCICDTAENTVVCTY